MDIINSVMASIPAWLAAIAMVVAGASAIAALTPTKRDDEVIGKIKKLIDLLALNVGNAKPK